ncbi:exopolysaccharide biosynthesis polyprenyl glycosylphosphotransferase [Burkholderiales bacterium JOSHI_001]|nr:exopolysaccharide biosynthesis polyprenyl glycosylphosphotransferase [Burkholderiales bacterium JOSHI_001]
MRIHRHNIHPGSFIGMAVDLTLGFASMMLAASTLRSRFTVIPGTVPELPLVLFGATVFAVTMAVMYALVGLYRPRPISTSAAALRTAVALCIGGYVSALAMRAIGDRGYIEQLVPAAMAYLVVGLLIERACMAMMHRVAPLPRVLIVGTGADAQAIAKDLHRPGKAARDLIGFYATGTEPEDPPTAAKGSRLFPAHESLIDLVARHDIQEIIVAVKEQRGGGVPMDQLLQCRIRGIPVLDLAAFSERTKGEVPIDSLKGSWLVYGDGFVQGAMRRTIKRIFDIIFSSALIALTSPLMLVTMVAIRLESAGPLIYRQERVGLGGRVFSCMKFRSMCVDAERDGVARWAQKNDSRITRVGSFIRKTRIDELPQLLSVLRGEMSLVGPRPERPTFVEQLKAEIPFYELRHSVKPGLTGWAQVRHHYAGSMDDARRKTQFDLYYVKNNSLFLDVLVLIETVSVVILHEGL